MTARALENQKLVAATALMLDSMFPALNAAVTAAMKRYPKHTRTHTAWLNGAIYGVVTQFVYAAVSGDEERAEGVPLIHGSVCALLDEIFSKNDGDFNRTLEQLVPDAFAKRGNAQNRVGRTNDESATPKARRKRRRKPRT